MKNNTLNLQNNLTRVNRKKNVNKTNEISKLLSKFVRRLSVKKFTPPPPPPPPESFRFQFKFYKMSRVQWNLFAHGTHDLQKT